MTTTVLFLVFAYISGIFSRFFISSVYKDEAKVVFFKEQKRLFRYLFIPGYLISYLVKNKSAFNSEFRKELKYVYIITEALSFFASLILFSNNGYFELMFSNSTADFLLLVLFSGIVYFGLLYLSLFDIITFSIPEAFAKRLLLFVLAANGFIALIRIISTVFFKTEVFQYVQLGRLDNLLAGVLIGFIIWAIIRLTKQEGMGEGDIDVMAIAGFALGFPVILYSFYYTLIIGSVISVAYGLMIQKFKNVQIPFVPFIFLGFLTALILGDKFLLIIR